MTAEDGQVYERKAIEEWLGRARPEGQAAKSPVTNEPMGPRLFEARQVRNTIKGMVESGALSGSKADGWRQRLAEEAEVAEEKRKAEGGDGRAAWQLGVWYYRGEKGLGKDKAQAFRWWKRGADLGHATAMYFCGICYEDGCGVAANDSLALIYYTRAAEGGSETGCYSLGCAFFEGDLGLLKRKGRGRGQEVVREDAGLRREGLLRPVPRGGRNVAARARRLSARH